MDAYIALDIETLVLPLTESRKKEFEETYEPPSNYKDPEKIAKHRETAISNLADSRKFYIDGCRPISIAMGLCVQGTGVTNIECVYSENSDELALAFIDYLNSFETYNVVGFNLKGFDLLVLSTIVNKSRLELRRKLARYKIIDLMEWPLRGYKLKDAARAYGIEPMGLTGASIAALYRDGDIETIKAYNCDDVRITGELYLALSRIYDLG